MRRKFVLLAMALAALLALAAPASSMAKISPANYGFEIPGDANGPKLVTSLGSCTLKITGTVPANESSATPFEIPAPVATSCTTGTSVTIAGSRWHMNVSSFPSVLLYGEGITFRFSSLPGCKLSSTLDGGVLNGLWSNGMAYTMSYFQPERTVNYQWQNDAGTCALKGTESVAFADTKVNGSGGKSDVGAIVKSAKVNTPITITPYP